MSPLPAGQFLGNTVKSCAMTGFRLTEAAYQPGMNLRAHSHELAKFCFVLTGSYTETLGRNQFVRKRGALVYQPPTITHAESHNEFGRHLMIEIDSARLNNAEQYLSKLNTVAILSSGAAVAIVTKLYSEFRRPDSFSHLAIEGLAVELLVETCRTSLVAERRPPKWLQQASDLLRVNFRSSLTHTEIAASVRVHPVHLARTFRQFHRCTIGDYVRALRIDYASRLLRESDSALSEIALSAGFADQGHFAHSFKRATGMTPKQYRELLR
jgi:AraC family transcriptional regulator